MLGRADRIGLTKKVSVGIEGDAKLVAEQILDQLSATAGDAERGDTFQFYFSLRNLGFR